MTMNETHGITEDAVTGNADTGQTNDSQVENTVKTFTQDEVNELIGKRVAQVNKKFDGVDMEEYKALKGLKEQVEEEQLIKKEDFNSVLKKHKEKADAEVSRLRNELETIKIDGALINASSRAKAVSPEHVAQLLRKNIKLGEDGNVVVTDSDGKTRYTDNADLMSVDNLVEEFLSSNQYFKASGPSGSGASGNTNNATQQSLDLAQLDMNNPEHRKLYTEMKRQGKV
tara:strand:+ start:5746 stop:6429 length:684 start_codon:yes stop_codon:yes gene_type:complete